jgi:glutathione synthase
MRKYKVLTLTDHGGHNKENSIYAILSQMSQHAQCEYVDVASRSNPLNANFFNNKDFSRLEVKHVDGSFSYDMSGKQFIDNTSSSELSDYDIIFMRLPRPVSDGFLLGLKRVAVDRVIINDPEGIITCSSKAFLLNFPGCCPPMRLCKSIEEVNEFSQLYDIVLKPLREYGGKGLVKIVGNILNDGKENHDKNEYLQTIEKEIIQDGYLAMKYLPNVKNGDKRLIVVGGQILACSLRLPAQDSWLCNVAQGGKSVSSRPTSEEYKIVKKIYPMLEKNGILISGVDTLEDDNGKRILSEINALSIGGFPQAEAHSGEPIIKIMLDRFFTYAAS